MLFVNPRENPRLVVTAQVQVFKPDEVALRTSPLDYRYRVGDGALYLLELGLRQFRQVLQLGFHLTQLRQRQLALCHAVVIRAGVQMVRRVRIGYHHLDAFQLHRHVLEL